jgi:hypothetical protein
MLDHSRSRGSENYSTVKMADETPEEGKIKEELAQMEAEVSFPASERRGHDLNGFWTFTQVP